MAKRKAREPLIQLPLERYEQACHHAAELEIVEGMIAEACMMGVDAGQCEAAKRGLEWAKDQIRRKCAVAFPDQPNPIREAKE